MQWYAGYLIELGLPRDGFSCRATTQDLEGVEGGFRIQVMAHLKKELSLSLSGARINWAVDDSVDLSSFRTMDFKRFAHPVSDPWIAMP